MNIHGHPVSGYRGAIPYIAGIALFLLSVSLYWRIGEYSFMGGYSFVNLDDESYVHGNPQVLRGLTWESVSWAFTTFHAANWHPLTWLSHMLDVELFGRDPGWHHRMNLVFHLINTELLLILLLRMTGNLWPSVFVAALFGVHPLHVESVVWIAERKDVLSTSFFLLTLLAYSYYAKHPGKKSYLCAILLFILGLLCKPMLVTLPAILLLLDWWPLDRVPQTRIKYLLAEKVPFISLSIISCAVTYMAQSRGGMVQSLEHIPLTMRLLNASVSYAAYLGKAIWPSSLSVFYPHPATIHTDIALWKILGSAGLLVGISILVFRQKSRRPYLAAGWLWYSITLLPVIGLIQVGGHALADRYTYIPLMGIFIAAAWGIHGALEGWRYRSSVLWTGGIAGVLALSLVTWAQVGYWKNSITLFSRSLAVTEANWVAMSSLGLEYVESGRVDEGIAFLDEVVRIRPTDFMAWNNLGLAYSKIGQLELAVRCYQKSLSIKPDYINALSNLGTAYIRQGKPQLAIHQLETALGFDANMPEVLNNIGVAYTEQGMTQEAIDSYRRAISIKREYADAWYNLGIAYEKLGRHQQANDYFIQARKYK